MKKGLILLFLLFALIPNLCLAQELESKGDSVASESGNYLIASTGFQNKASFMSRDFGQKIPIFSTELLFWHRSGVYLSTTLSKFLTTDLSWQKGVGAGFFKPLNPKLDLDFSYHHFFGASNLNSTGQDNLGMAQGTIGLDWGILYSTTQAMYLVNSPGDFFISSRHSRYFELDKPIKGGGVLSFEPRFSVFLGTSNYYRIGGYEFTRTQYLETQRFTAQGLEMALPITLSYSKVEFQLEPRWVIPTQVPEYDTSLARFQLAIKASYTLSLKRSK
jgi:hypothetical protein